MSYFIIAASELPISKVWNSGNILSSDAEVDWEKIRRDVRLTDLLSSSTNGEDVQEPKCARLSGREGIKAEEVRKWMRKADLTTRGEVVNGTSDRADGEWEKGETSQLVTYKVIETLVLLEEKTHMMEERMRRIEAEVNEFINKKNVDNPAKENRLRALAGPKAHRCTLGRSMLALRILGLVTPASPLRSRPLEQDEKTSIALRTLTKRGWSWPEKMSPSYGGLQALLEDDVQQIEERQAELEEMAKGIEDRQSELKKVAKSLEEKQVC
jgi:hypothetical protein